MTQQFAEPVAYFEQPKDKAQPRRTPTRRAEGNVVNVQGGYVLIRSVCGSSYLKVPASRYANSAQRTPKDRPEPQQLYAEPTPYWK